VTAVKEQNALPKSARQQLARDQRGEAGVHPDADVLTAFGEGALAEAERARVTEHIARCTDCREILFLTAPEPAANALSQEASCSHSREGWWARYWRKVMPAVAAAVAIVVVGSAVLLDREHTSERAPKNAVADVAKQPAEPSPASVPEPEPAKSQAATPKKSPSPLPAKHSADKSTPASPGTIGALAKDEQAPATVVDTFSLNQRLAAPGPHGAVEPKGSVSNYQRVAVTPPAPPPPPVAGGVLGGIVGGVKSTNQRVNAPSTQNVNVTAAAPEVNTQTAEKAQVIAPAQVQDMPLNGRSPQNLAVTMAGAANYGARTDSASVNEIVQASAHWRITHEGMLERSFGNGAWEPVLSDAKAKFRVVSVIGNDVWAGGEGAALYHSLDSGLHWSRVMITDEDNSAATITAIHFRDARNGEIATKEGTVWETSDGGAHWSRR
jgi:hypothetical protein